MSDAPPNDGLVLANEELRIEVIKLRALLGEATTNPEGDYYLGLRCGVEDRDIHDRVESVVAGESPNDTTPEGSENV